jgi:hypothetical protein
LSVTADTPLSDTPLSREPFVDVDPAVDADLHAVGRHLGVRYDERGRAIGPEQANPRRVGANGLGERLAQA